MDTIIDPQVQTENVNRFAIPVRMGLLIAIIKILLSTISYQFFLASWGMTMLFTGISFIIGVLLLISTGKQQRKALGGYISFKEAFQAIFVALLIFVVLNYLYDVIYMKWIDPSMMDKIKESSIGFAEKMGAPQERLDKMAEEFDKQGEKQWTIGKQAVSLFSSIAIYSIVGFICAAIVKKNKPEYMA
jgi:hypothetical protein